MGALQGPIAVVGGTGFIGSHLVNRLAAENHHVFAIARGSRRLDTPVAHARFREFAECDITDRRQVKETFRRLRPKTVFHLAAQPDGAEDFSQILTCLNANTIGTAHVLEAASAAGADVLVYADSTKVFGNGRVPFREDQPPAPICSYAIAKSAAWSVCKLASAFTGMAVCGLRPAFVYGPRQNRNLIVYIEECLRTGKPVRLQGGFQTRDLLFIEDAVDALIAAATHKVAWGHSIPIGGGHELALREICVKAMQAYGAEVPILEQADEPRLTEIWRSFCDNEEARTMLKWTPQTPLIEGLRRTFHNGRTNEQARNTAVGSE